ALEELHRPVEEHREQARDEDRGEDHVELAAVGREADALPQPAGRAGDQELGDDHADDRQHDRHLQRREHVGQGVRQPQGQEALGSWSFSGSTEVSPCTVLRTTGKNVTITPTAAFDSQSTPRARPRTGARPTIGTAPNAVASGRKPRRRKVLNAISVPVTKPRSRPSANPNSTSRTNVR